MSDVFSDTFRSQLSKEERFAFCQDYDFLKYFEILQTIHSVENSIETLCNAITESLGDYGFRKLILDGIKYRLAKNKKDFSIVSSIHSQFCKENLSKKYIAKRQDDVVAIEPIDDDNTWQVWNTINQNDKIINSNNSNNNNNNDNSGAFRTFDIQSLKCSILSYLNLKTFLDCHRVSRQWLYDSHQNQSIFRIDFDDLAQYWSISKIVRRMNRFKHISQLEIEYSNKYEKFFNNRRIFSHYHNVKKLVVKGSGYGNNAAVCNLINNNCNHLQTITLNGLDIFSRGKYSDGMGKATENMIFPNLAAIKISRTKMDSFALINRDIDEKIMVSIDIGDSTLSKGFWNGLAKMNNSLALIKCFSLRSNRISSDLPNMERIQHIASKLVNIEALDFSTDCRWRGCRGIEDSLLVHLCGNKLKVLEIELDVSKLMAINDYDIQCDFQSLEHSKVCFFRDNTMPSSENDDNDNGSSDVGNIDVKGSTVVKRVLRMLSVSCNPKNGISNNNYNDNIGNVADFSKPKRICKVETLQLSGLSCFDDLSMIDLFNCLNSVKYENIVKLKTDHPGCLGSKQQCSMLDMIKLMEMIDDDYIRGFMDRKLQQNLHVNVRRLDLCIPMPKISDRCIYKSISNRLCDYLVRWYNYQNGNIRIAFNASIDTSQLVLLDLNFVYYFGKLLKDKMIGGDVDDINELLQESFATPFSDMPQNEHIFKRVQLVGNRVLLQVHLIAGQPQSRFEFVIVIKSIKKSYNYSIDDCKCNAKKM